MKQGIKSINRCIKCHSIIRKKCKSGLCRECQRKYWAEKTNKRRVELYKHRVENHCCMDCGTKLVKQYPIRCEKCAERQRRYAKKRYEKSKELK